MRMGFVPSYVLESGLGRKVAQLKGLRRGWSYPTFLVQYIRNPGPFLLFDKLLIDEEAAERTIEFARHYKTKSTSYENRVIQNVNPTKKEVEVLNDLLKSNLFEKKNIEKMLTVKDYQEIEAGYYLDTGMRYGVNEREYVKRFQQALSVMKEKYGAEYASPSPEKFEAMNLNLINVISKRLSADPLDDICRIPLYEVKSIHSQHLKSKASYDVAFKIVDQARQILYLPSNPIKDPDEFLRLHSDKHVRSFRKKIQELTAQKADRNEMSREIVEAEDKLKELDSTSWTIAIGLLGLPEEAYAILSGNFASGALGAIPIVAGVAKAIADKWNAKKCDWLKVIKGFSQV
jgi:hypothetical protein